MEEGPRLRSENLPDDTHLLETTEVLDETVDEVPLINDEDTYLEQLQALHEANQLGDTNITADNIPVLYRSFINNTIEEEVEAINVPETIEVPLLPINDINSDINSRNILPDGTRCRVRFKFPEFSRK